MHLTMCYLQSDSHSKPETCSSTECSLLEYFLLSSEFMLELQKWTNCPARLINACRCGHAMTWCMYTVDSTWQLLCLDTYLLLSCWNYSVKPLNCLSLCWSKWILAHLWESQVVHEDACCLPMLKVVWCNFCWNDILQMSTDLQPFTDPHPPHRFVDRGLKKRAFCLVAVW